MNSDRQADLCNDIILPEHMMTSFQKLQYASRQPQQPTSTCQLRFSRWMTKGTVPCTQAARHHAMRAPSRWCHLARVGTLDPHVLAQYTVLRMLLVAGLSDIFVTGKATGCELGGPFMLTIVDDGFSLVLDDLIRSLCPILSGLRSASKRGERGR